VGEGGFYYYLKKGRIKRKEVVIEKEASVVPPKHSLENLDAKEEKWRSWRRSRART